MIKSLLYSLVLLFLLISCQNGNNPVGTNHEYSFIAKVGNEYWQGACYLDFANNDSQNLFLSPDNQFDYIRIKIDFEGIGEYQLADSSAALEETIGGDVHDGTYYSFAHQNDIIKVNYYDEKKDVIKGTFSFKIRKQTSIIDIKGTFKAKFINTN